MFTSYTIVSKVQGVDAECLKSRRGIREVAAGLSVYNVRLTDRFSLHKRMLTMLPSLIQIHSSQTPKHTIFTRHESSAVLSKRYTLLQHLIIHKEKDR